MSENEYLNLVNNLNTIDGKFVAFPMIGDLIVNLKILPDHVEVRLLVNLLLNKSYNYW